MSNLYEVTENDVTQLDSTKLRLLLNDLLLAEARKYGIPTSSVEVTIQDDVSDNGVDALVNNQVDVPISCRIPQGLSVWQYKAGNVSPSKIRTESEKLGVQAIITQNGSYCFVIGHSCSDTMRRSREAILDEAFTKVGKVSKRNLFTAAEIAEWVSDYPALASKILRFDKSDEFKSFQEWQDLEQSGTYIEFQTNENRTNIINQIVELINSQSILKPIRLGGSNGSGKTRLIQEVIRAADVADLTHYASTPDAVPDNLFRFINSRTTIHKLILVVDECDDDDFQKLSTRSQICNGRVILITIGSGETSRGEENFFTIDTLDDDTIRRIIHLAAPLYPELQLYITRIVEGSVKLAIALVKSIVENQSFDTVSKLMNLSNVQHILRSLCKTDEERDAMYALSLMRYIGLDEDASTEGQVVSQFLNLDFKALKRTALQMQRRGLVIKYGRFRYVTPPLLATWFAKEIWEAQQSEIISELFPQLPSMSAQYRLLERLGDIGEESLGEPIIEKLFDSKNALGNIDAIDDQETAHLFRLLSNASPNTSLKILNRIFKKVPRERLLEFKRGRREIIYTLEGLLRRSETFYEAARLLLRLADAENETWGNNASGIWRDIFFTRLGIGTFPAWERHKLIKEAIHHSSSQQIRLLGVKALSAALSGYESRSYGSGPGGYLSKGWRPELWEDIWKTYQSALELIDQLLRDEDIVVANEAISTFINSIRLLLKTPLKLDILKRIEDLLEHLNLPSQKKHLIDTLGHAIKYETNSLTTSEITTFQKWREELLGNSFHDRLHRWVGELNDSDRQSVYVRQETPIDLNAIIKQLALEGYSQPELLHAELEWLSSLNAQYAPNFALELGRLDVETIWLTEWLQLLPNATLCLSYYLYGKSLVTDNHETIEELLNEWRQTRPELAFTVFTTIQLLGGTDKRAKWIVELIERNWLPPEYLIKLSRDWLKPLSDSMFIEFLRILEAKDKSQYTSVMLGLISEWLQTHHEYNRDTTPFILSILNRPPYYDRLSPRYPQAGWYEWRMICLFYLNTFTEEIVKAATHLMKYWDVTPDGPEDDRLYILIEALQIEPEITWSIISNALLDSEYYWPSMHFDMTNSLNTGTLLESVEINVLMNWIDNNKPLAARIASEMIRVEQTPLPTLARNLIINYSDDEIVRNNLLPQKRGMSWAGSRSNRLQKMLDIVHTWLTDENEIVQEWASEVAEDIERDIRQAKRYDDETNLLYN